MGINFIQKKNIFFSQDILPKLVTFFRVENHVFIIQILTIEFSSLVGLLVGFFLSLFWFQFDEVVDSQNGNCSLCSKFQAFYLRNGRFKNTSFEVVAYCSFV